MSVDDIQFLKLLLTTFGVVGGIAAAYIIFLLKSYIPSYMSKKAENLATREDVSTITDEVERIKIAYSVQLEELKTKQQVLLEELKAKHQTKHLLRMAAIDRRLMAHQEAFALWRGLSTHSEEVGISVMKCQEWYENNCLYLEPNVRIAFVEAYSAAHMHREFIQAGADSKLLKENWANIAKFPNVVFEAVKLPALTETESKSLFPEPPESQKK